MGTFNKQTLFRALLDKEWRLISTAFYGRSGSYFLSGLLDGHPQILAFPPWAFRFPRLFLKNGKLIDTVSIDELHPLLFEEIKSIFTADTNLGLHFPDAEAQTEQVFAVLVEIVSAASDNTQTIPRRLLLIALCIAWWVYSGGDLEELAAKDTILYGIHTPERDYINVLYQDFRPFYLVYTVREPINALTSHVAGVWASDPTVDYFVGVFLWSFFSGLIPPFMTHDSCFAVKNEALHAYPEQTMRDLATRLGLSWNDILLRHTFDGKAVYHQYPDGVQRIFHEKTRVPRCERNLFSCGDCAMMTLYMRDRYKAWNYPCCPQSAADAFLGGGVKDSLDAFDTLPLPDESRAHIMMKLKRLKEIGPDLNYVRPLPSAYEHQITCKYKG